MTQRYSKYLKEINLSADVILLNAAYMAVFYITFRNFEVFFRSKYFEFLLVFNIAWIMAAYLLRVHHMSRTLSFENEFRKLLNALGLLLLIIFAFMGIKGNIYDKSFVFKSYIAVTLGLSISNIGLYIFLKYYRKIGYNFRKVIIVGYGEIARDLRKFFTLHPEHGFKFKGHFDDKSESVQVLGKVSEIENYIKKEGIDEIYCCLPYMDPQDVNDLIKLGEDNFVKVKIVPDFRGFPYKGVEVQLYDFIPVLNFREIPLDDQVNYGIKRAFDIVFSTFVMVFIMSWMMPLLILLIKLESKGPAIFTQLRSGKNNEPFVCYKFRTMRMNEDADKKQATKDDDRITKIGAFLRKTNLDEMPQFLNVLKGEMSVIGPRPHMLKHTEEFSQQVDKFMIRHSVKPGITGLAQAKGYRGETNTELKLKNRVKLDRFYVENWSLLFDFKIIAMTIVSMLQGDENAY